MSSKLIRQGSASAEEWEAYFMGVLVLLFSLVLGSITRHALFSPMYLLCVFHKLQLQDAAGLQPAFLLPVILLAWDLSSDAGTAHHDTSTQSGQWENWHLVLENSGISMSRYK